MRLERGVSIEASFASESIKAGLLARLASSQGVPAL
ncbi:hypothetical protein FHT72_003908 [Rhizobium sp. BK077]|nr:hypothetical protein [Rhizobium sp. BK112]MBB3369406.1 hypothetical protein [Rhizobium sp. BK077]MBB4180049.1 hypothetical protein [Rhizobium sp. BK109]